MLEIHCAPSTREVLFDGTREDFALLATAVKQAIASGSEQSVPFTNVGPTPLKSFLVRKGTRPNRASVENQSLILSVAPEITEQFLSFITFPADADLSESPIAYHHHFDAAWGDDTYIAPDTLPVVFGLKQP